MTYRARTPRTQRRGDLGVLRVINKPTTAAPAYGTDESEDKAIAVFDSGGNTFLISKDSNNELLCHPVTEFKSKQRTDLAKEQICNNSLNTSIPPGVLSFQG